MEHANWGHPQASDWIDDVSRVAHENPEPKVFVAHSLGCLLVVQGFSNMNALNILGGFLVALPDPKAAAFPKTANGFLTPQFMKPSFRTWILASRNDPYASLEFSKLLAFHWNSRFIDVGEKGHINLGSNLGFWDQGWDYFKEFLTSLNT